MSDCKDFVRRLALPVLLWGTGGAFVHVYAQQEAAFLQYWKVETQWCPAAVGRTPQLEINTALQMHALGFEDAGMTMYAGANTAFQLGKTRHGAGVYFYNDQFGLFSQITLALQYAYHLRLWGGTFSLGVEADLLNDKIDGSKADFGQSNDPAFPKSKVSGTGFDVGAGLYYQRKALSIGLSCKNLTAPTITMGDTHQYNKKTMLNFSGAYNIKLKSPLYSLTPSVMVRTDMAEIRTDITCRFGYEYEKRHLYGGLNYAPQRSIGLFFGGTVKGVDLCYNYEAFTEGMGILNGNHEITLAYRMDLNLDKRGRNLHKSVRWL